MRNHVVFSTGADSLAKGNTIRQERSWMLTGKMKETSSYTDKYQNILQVVTDTEGTGTISFPFIQSHISIGRHMDFLLYLILKKSKTSAPCAVCISLKTVEQIWCTVSSNVFHSYFSAKFELSGAMKQTMKLQLNFGFWSRLDGLDWENVDRYLEWAKIVSRI